jgi:hypothetical protein
MTPSYPIVTPPTADPITKVASGSYTVPVALPVYPTLDGRAYVFEIIPKRGAVCIGIKGGRRLSSAETDLIAYIGRQY